MYQELKTKLDDAIRSRTKGDEKFQAFVAEEIASIKNAISKEQEVPNLHTYTPGVCCGA